MGLFDKEWQDKANALLAGRKIVSARYQTEAEAEDAGWSRRAVVLVLDNGIEVWASMDDEGNDAGALFTTSEAVPILPKLQGRPWQGSPRS